MIVSKARFDLLRHNMEQLVSQLRADLAAADTRYDDLLRMYHEARTVTIQNTVAPMKPVERSKLAADMAIDDVVEARGGNAILRRQLQRYVNLERQKGTPEKKIEASIRDWRDPDQDEDAA